MPRHTTVLKWLLVGAVAFVVLSFDGASNPFPKIEVESFEGVVSVEPFAAIYQFRAGGRTPDYQATEVVVEDQLVVRPTFDLAGMIASVREPTRLCGGRWIPMSSQDGRWVLPFSLPNGAYEIKLRALWDSNTADFAFTMNVYGGASRTDLSCTGS